MSATRFLATLALLAGALLASTAALGHGASRGLHLHVSPDPAAIGTEVEIAADAFQPVAWLKVGFVGRDPIEVRPERPLKRLVAKLVVPAGKPGATASVQAEARTVGGRTLRASAVVVLKGSSLDRGIGHPGGTPGPGSVARPRPATGT